MADLDQLFSQNLIVTQVVLGKHHQVRRAVRSDPRLICSTDRDGQTPLHEIILYASLIEQISHVQFRSLINLISHLLKHYPKLIHLNQTDRQGWTLLHNAAYFGLPEVVELLIDNQKTINLNVRTASGQTALHLAVKRIGELPDKKSSLIQVIRLLLNHQADPDLADGQGMTAHGLAIVLQQRQVQQMMINQMISHRMQSSFSGIIQKAIFSVRHQD